MMKPPLFLIVLISLLTSCVNTPDRKPSSNSVDSVMNSARRSSSGTATCSPKEYGKMILEGKVKPSDNLETEACLGELMNKDVTDRDFYFSVYRKIATESDGALSEIVCGFTKAFFSVYPDYCITQLNGFDAKEKNLFLENLAYEFYASGVDYEADINEYFREAESQIKTRNKSNSEALNEIKRQLILKAKRMNE